MYTVHPISAMLKESHFYRYNKFEIESPFYKEDEGFGWWKLLDDTPYTTGEEKLAGWNSADDAKKGRETIASVEERVARWVWNLPASVIEEGLDSEEELCCVGCGKDGEFLENRDGDTMCECCMTDEEEEDDEKT